jgi:3',5'-cyclic AMP phosphodiesterase CpdA
VAVLLLAFLLAVDFTIVLLPDTQKYAESYPAKYLAQTEWIAANAAREKIAFVVHLGDITENNTPAEWELASRAMATLDGRVPYSVLPGNHDGYAETRDAALYHRHFPPSRFEKHRWYGGHSGDTNENNYCVFRAAGEDYLVINLRFGPSDDDLAWAAAVLGKHPRHRAIVATHAYMYNDNTRLGPGDDYSPHKKSLAWNDGEEMWEKLVRKHANIFLVVSGHVYGAGRQTSRGDRGNVIHEMLADYQKYPNGGDGWLRLLRFDLKKREIAVRTYSPARREYLVHPDHDFVLPLPR